VGLKSALREFWDICGCLYMAPEAAAVHLERLRLQRLPPSPEKQEEPRSIRWYRDGEALDHAMVGDKAVDHAMLLGDVEPGQQFGRLAIKNVGDRALRALTIEAPVDVELAWNYSDPAWYRALRRARELRVGESLSFVARARPDSIPGRRTGEIRVSEDAEPQWETYG
jgi:hypothetical protein